MIIHKALKEVRTESGLKQTEFAKMVGLTQTYISLIESGNKVPSFDVIERYNKISKVPIAIIMWKSLEESDVPKHKRKNYKELKPLVDNLINQMF